MSSVNRSATAPAPSLLSAVTTALLTVTLAGPLFVGLILASSDRSASPVCLLVTAASQILLAALERRMQNSYAWRDSGAASVLYYLDIESRVFRAGLVVAVVAMASCVVVVTSIRLASSEFALLATVPGFLFALSILRSRLLRASVDGGTFGTKRAEAQALINFMLRNAHRLERGGGGTPLVSRDDSRKPALAKLQRTRARAGANVAVRT